MHVRQLVGMNVTIFIAKVNTGCLLISVACLGINNLMIFWSLRAEILGKQTSKVYKFIHMKGLIKKLSCQQ